MKLHAARYGLTAAFGTLASCMAVVALRELTVFLLFGVSIGLCLFVGILCSEVIPYSDIGGK